MWNDFDLKLLSDKEIELSQVKQQVKTFEDGLEFSTIVRPAIVGNGLIRFSKEVLQEKVKEYDNISQNKKIVKFVPASGAASRMFKTLFEYSNAKEKNEDVSANDLETINIFIQHLPKFAFYNDLMKSIGKDKDYSTDNETFNKEAIDFLLTEKGLNYGNKPKGLLKFHKYKNHERTPVYEHLVEGALYANSNGVVNIHFTVSPEHIDGFKKHIAEIITEVENSYGVKYKIDFSIQKASTDTLAVDMNNKPFRNEDNSLLFRPGGHGALIENLNEIDADLIFIKNIDNVVPDRLKQTTVDYKKALASLLFEYQNQIFEYIEQIDNAKDLPNSQVVNIENFIQDKLCINFKDTYKFSSKTDKLNFLKNKLNRPLRVCGMVKNEGEPGGGPFWAENADKTISLQIIEASQIDNNNNSQLEILKQSTHFNPVDLVCATKDYKGNKFDLHDYIDWSTCFISEKSKNGKKLKALELPGLWNGAMANWNTIFVEVDLITFNPVKTVNDLLRPEHIA